MPNPAAVIIGAGDATGGAIARAFAAEGLTACVNRRERNADQLEALAQSIRDEGHQAHAFPGDAREEDAMIALFDQVEAEVGPIEVAVFNIGANVNFPITETTVPTMSATCFVIRMAGCSRRVRCAALALRCQPDAAKSNLVAASAWCREAGQAPVPPNYQLPTTSEAMEPSAEMAPSRAHLVTRVSKVRSKPSAGCTPCWNPRLALQTQSADRAAETSLPL